jgi:hypothetical protein
VFKRLVGLTKMTFPKSFQVGGAGLLTIRNIKSEYTVQPLDNNVIINCTSGTFTVFLTAAAMLGAGFNVQINNTGTGTITIDPSGSETIDSNTTWQLSKGQGINILCDGTNFQTIGIRTSGQAANTVALGNDSNGRPSIAITGNGQVALGGAYASGGDSFAAAIGNNNSAYGAQGFSAVVLGNTSNATNSYSAALGSRGAISSATYSVVLGGIFCEATAEHSYAFGHRGLAAYAGKYAYGVFSTGTAGTTQGGYMVLTISTTDATATKLGSDGSAGGATNQVILANNQAMVVTGSVLCRQKVANSDQASGWTFSAVIRRGANAASTTLVAAVTPILVAQDVSLAATALSITADTTNGGLAITVTGIAATNLRWLATVNSSEVVYA